MWSWRAVQKQAKTGIMRAALEDRLDNMYETVCSIYRQYDAAASLLDDYNSVEELLRPHIMLDRNTLRFTVVRDHYVVKS